MQSKHTILQSKQERIFTQNIQSDLNNCPFPDKNQKTTEDFIMDLFTLPPDFVKKMQALLLSEWEEFENCYQNNKYQALRFNPLKHGLYRQDYEQLLSDLGIQKTEPVLWAKHAYYYPEEARPGRHPYHEMGLYYIQEPSAMCAAELLAPLPGERVLDLCAAPGGKSTQLASFLNQKGLFVCNEIHPTRCKILSQNIERSGIANAIVTNEDSETLAKRFPEYFHKILVDAPCSGEGMFRKNPEAALEWSEKQVEICAKRQFDILENAAKMLISGGTMVYSTCTFSPEENEGIIGRFLETHPEFSITHREIPYFSHGCPDWGNDMKELSHTFRLWPHRLHGEGHFVALLQKNERASDEDSLEKNFIKDHKKKKNNKNIFQTEKKLFEELKRFTSQTLSKQMEDFVLSGDFVLFGEQLYRLPDESPDLSGLRVLRPGLHIGSFTKNIFKPAHALALFLGSEDVKNNVFLSLSDVQTEMYFKGEAFDCESLPINANKGWCLVCINGYSAGWGKLSAGTIKNHYPKGLRKDLLISFAPFSFSHSSQTL